MTTLYIIRHAEAEGNLYRRIHGWYNSLITEQGYRQIAALAQRFRDVPIDAVYSSDLFRTMTTAQAIYPSHHLELHTRSDLREISMGVWEDRTWGEVAHFDAQNYAQYSGCDPNWKNQGGESRQEAGRRIKAAVLDIASRHPEQTVAVVCHGDIIRCLQAEVLGVPIPEMKTLGHCDNTGVMCLRVSGEQVEVVFRNDNSHLPEELSTLAKQQWWRQGGTSPADANFWFRPLEEGDRSFYTGLHRETWQGLYGHEPEYDANAFFDAALERGRQNRRAVSVSMLGEIPAGVVELDLERDEGEGAGHIRFLALAPDYRGRGLAPQLLGQAVSTLRPLGREWVRLLCAPENEKAQRFYTRHGFHSIGQQPGHRGRLDQLEKYIGYHTRAVDRIALT